VEQPVAVLMVGRVVEEFIFTITVSNFAVPALGLSFIAFILLVGKA
jgi:hypothetical protein